MSVETHRVLIGACGWKHKAWLNDFYSEDLPEEWQLGFYSNEFPVVYVPSKDWLNISHLDNSELSEWAEDVSDSFRFILEVPAKVLNSGEEFAEALEKVKLLDEHCLGIVLKLSADTVQNTSLFKKNIELAKSITLVCIEHNGVSYSDEISHILDTYNISEVWNGDSNTHDSLIRGNLALSYISGDNLDMIALRKVIETCLAASTEKRTSVLIIDGSPPSIELLHNADIILNLL